MLKEPCSHTHCPALGSDVCCAVHRPDKVVERAKAIVTKYLEFKDPKTLKLILVDLDSTI